MTPLRVEFDLTVHDVTALLEAACQKDPGVRQVARRIKRIGVGLLLLLAALEYGLYLLSGEVNVVNVAAAVPVLVALAVTWPTRSWARRIGRRQAAAQLGTPAGRAFLGPRTVVVGADGLNVQTDYAVTDYRWSAVMDITQTPGHLFLILPGPSYLPIPRTGFVSDRDFDRFCGAVADLAAASGGLAHDHPLGR